MVWATSRPWRRRWSLRVVSSSSAGTATEALPGARPRLRRERLVGPHHVHRLASLAVGQDGDEIVLVEAAGVGRPAQRLVHLPAAEEQGQLGGLGHLGPDPYGAAGGGGPQPALGALADGQEDALVLPLRPHPGLHRAPALGVVGVVL